MMRRLLILLLLLLAPAVAQAAVGSSRSWSPKGLRRPAARSSSRSRCGPSRAGMAIGSIRATPACRWTSSGSFRPATRSAAALSGADAADRRRDDELRVTSSDYAVLVRLKVPKDAKGVVPIRASASWLACTDKICVPESRAIALDVPVGTVEPDRRRSSTSGGARFRGRSHAGEVRDCRRQAARRHPASARRRGRGAVSVSGG